MRRRKLTPSEIEKRSVGLSFRIRIRAASKEQSGESFSGIIQETKFLGYRRRGRTEIGQFRVTVKADGAGVTRSFVVERLPVRK